MNFVRGTVTYAVIGALLSTGFVRPSISAAADIQQERVTIHDIELASGNAFRGVVLSANGSGHEGVLVIAEHQDEVVAKAVSDGEGRFEMRLARGGVHKIVVAGQATYCRVWMPGTAPPAAKKSLALVTGGEVVRGQLLGGLSTSTAAVAAIAVVVGVVAITEATDDDAS